MLSASPPDVHERFAHATGITVVLPPDSPASIHRQMRRPADGKLMALISSGVYIAGPDNQPRWLGAYHIDVFPTTNADYLRFNRVCVIPHPASLIRPPISAMRRESNART